MKIFDIIFPSKVVLASEAEVREQLAAQVDTMAHQVGARYARGSTRIQDGDYLTGDEVSDSIKGLLSA